MTIQKLNLKCDDRVRIINVGPSSPTSLEGTLGSIIGISQRGPIDAYIVLLDTPYILKDFTHKAASIPEVCLKRI